jgi:hypothetical protein
MRSHFKWQGLKPLSAGFALSGRGVEITNYGKEKNYTFILPLVESGSMVLHISTFRMQRNSKLHNFYNFVFCYCS